MKLNLERVHHAQITIPKGAEQAGREFYCDFLGSKEIQKPESLQGRGGFWLEIGGFQIHVGTENDFDRTQTKAHIAYQVGDLAAWRAKLQEKGIKILDGVPIAGYDRFEFRDPFGNRVEFLQKI
jgi:catechol 2,3-dioxygenase-like lactoylglutathione lyase family enzyme